MRLKRLSVVAFLVFAAIALPSAQQSVRLQFEIFHDGSLVSSPEVAVVPGSLAKIAVPEVATIEFRPTFRNSEDLRIAFDIHACGKHLHPVIAVRANNAASASWPCHSDGDYRFRVIWVR